MGNAAERRSLHEAKVWLALRGRHGHWVTNDEIAKESGVKVRTVRQYTLQLVKQGVLERAETFPAYRFRLASKAESSGSYQGEQTSNNDFSYSHLPPPL
jgi:DNA-binding IclR family transcriptional regulator